ncbi:hypothetical protein F2Q69_00040428 [Brassica cretica]|uniref:Uncharacterized protein n=1 Tax=Brassica cretica TaxID=69181 RepID=A0A8S9NST8_BRACR|nr:hypothetical protein F2Q69_00040428 [Brassica cretica]
MSAPPSFALSRVGSGQVGSGQVRSNLGQFLDCTTLFAQEKPLMSNLITPPWDPSYYSAPIKHSMCFKLSSVDIHLR